MFHSPLQGHASKDLSLPTIEPISGSPLVCRPLVDMQEQYSPMVIESECYLYLYKDLTQAEELKTKQLSVLRRKCKPGEQRQ